MSVRSITRLAALPLLLLVVTCGGDDERPPAPGGSGGDAGEGSGGEGGDGGSAGEGGSAGGGEAGAPEGGGAGQAGSDPGPPPVCGNGIREGDELCDGTQGLESCLGLGLGTGTSTCVDCEPDTSQCSQPETCHDALDNDGDGDRDCEDDECSEVCADPCVTPGELPDPATVFGDTTGRAALSDPLCRVSEEGVATTGPEIIYRFVPENTGVLDLELTMLSGDLNLSVRTTCNDRETELGCAEGGAARQGTERLQVPVTAGNAVFVVVDGTGPGVVGTFTLHAQSIEIMCGDSKRTPDEQCDDGNQVSGDGCDADCQLESDETEDNGTFETADPFTDFGELVFAQISPPEDRDMFSVEVPGPSSNLEVQTFDLGNGECAAGVLDSLVEILDASRSTVVADDDSGDGGCSYAIATGLAAGTYFVRVRGTNRQSFPYALGIFLSP